MWAESKSAPGDHAAGWLRLRSQAHQPSLVRGPLSSGHRTPATGTFLAPHNPNVMIENGLGAPEPHPSRATALLLCGSK